MDNELTYKTSKKIIEDGFYKTKEDREEALIVLERFSMLLRITADQYQELATMLLKQDENGELSESQRTEPPAADTSGI